MVSSVKLVSLFGTSLFLKQNKDLFRFLEGTSSDRYGTIMDAFYAKTHIGGGFHRHFDGTHTLRGSYEAIKDRTGTVEMAPFIKAHFNDLVTPEGLPVFTLDREKYTALSNEVSEVLGGNITAPQIRAFIRDLNSYNLGEVIASGVGAAFLVAALRSGDPKAISRVTASNICLGIATANPWQLLLGMYGLAHGIYTGKITSYQLLRGAVSTAAGLAGYHVGAKLLGLGTGGGIVLAIGAAVATDLILDHLERQKKKTIEDELGKKNRHYILAMNPHILEKEFFKLLRRNRPLALGTLV